MTTDDLGLVLSAMHDDKRAVLRSQLTSIAIEISDRQRLTKQLGASLQEEVLELGSTILNLTREYADLYLKERVALGEQRRTLTKELRTEQRDSWREVQDLRREQRAIEQELVQAGQRRQRLEDMTNNAPGSV